MYSWVLLDWECDVRCLWFRYAITLRCWNDYRRRDRLSAHAVPDNANMPVNLMHAARVCAQPVRLENAKRSYVLSGVYLLWYGTSQSSLATYSLLYQFGKLFIFSESFEVRDIEFAFEEQFMRVSFMRDPAHNAETRQCIVPMISFVYWTCTLQCKFQFLTVWLVNTETVHLYKHYNWEPEIVCSVHKVNRRLR